MHPKNRPKSHRAHSHRGNRQPEEAEACLLYKQQQTCLCCDGSEDPPHRRVEPPAAGRGEPGGSDPRAGQRSRFCLPERSGFHLVKGQRQNELKLGSLERDWNSWSALLKGPWATHTHWSERDSRVVGRALMSKHTCPEVLDDSETLVLPACRCVWVVCWHTSCDILTAWGLKSC